MTQSDTPASPREDLIDTVRVVGAGLAAAVVIQTLLFQPFTIPSSSMEPGLVTGDYIVATKFPYGWSRASLPFNPPAPSGRLFGHDPKRGDVVVFRLPRNPQETWVKRIIGLPGDVVEVRSGAVIVNGQTIPQTVIGLAQDHDNPERSVTEVRERLADGREWLTYDGGPGSPGDDWPPHLVPQGFYLVIGDNRDNSLDGRFNADMGVGLLPATNVVARAEMVVASWRPGASLFKPWTWLNLQPGRFFQRIR